MKGAVFAMGALAAVLAIFIPSVYGLWFLCSDLVYCVLFPQLVLVLYYSNVNTYGSLAGYLIGMLLRLLGGEALLGLPTAVRYFYYTEEDTDGDGQLDHVTQLFPFRTFAMLVSLATIMAVSALTKCLFVGRRRVLAKKWDVFHCFEELDLSSLGFPSSDSSRPPVSSVVAKPEEGTPQLLSDKRLWREPPAPAPAPITTITTTTTQELPTIIITEAPIPMLRKKLPRSMTLHYAVEGEDNLGFVTTAL